MMKVKDVRGKVVGTVSDDLLSVDTRDTGLQQLFADARDRGGITVPTESVVEGDKITDKIALIEPENPRYVDALGLYLFYEGYELVGDDTSKKSMVVSVSPVLEISLGG